MAQEQNLNETVKQLQQQVQSLQQQIQHYQCQAAYNNQYVCDLCYCILSLHFLSM